MGKRRSRFEWMRGFRGRHGKVRGGGKLHKSRTPTIESLETRDMLSAVCTYTGQDGRSMSDPGNYSISGGVAGQTTPRSGDTVRFPATAQNTQPIDDLPADTVLGEVEFQSSNFSISGSSPLAVSGLIEVDAGFSVSITAPVALHGAVQCDVEAGASLQIGGPVTDDGSTAGLLQKTGPGAVVLSGECSYSGGTAVLAGELLTGSLASSLAVSGGTTVDQNATYALQLLSHFP